MSELLFPLAISVALSLAIIIVFLAATFFLDFVKDSWKLPFAVAIDVIDFMAMMNPGWLDAAATIGGVIIFILLARSAMKYPFMFISGAEGAMNIGFPVLNPLVGQVTGLLPINTALMFIDSIID